MSEQIIKRRTTLIDQQNPKIKMTISKRKRKTPTQDQEFKNLKDRILDKTPFKENKDKNTHYKRKHESFQEPKSLRYLKAKNLTFSSVI